MAAPHASLETQTVEQLAQIVKTDGLIGGTAENASKSLLRSHIDILHHVFAAFCASRRVVGSREFL